MSLSSHLSSWAILSQHVFRSPFFALDLNYLEVSSDPLSVRRPVYLSIRPSIHTISLSSSHTEKQKTHPHTVISLNTTPHLIVSSSLCLYSTSTTISIPSIHHTRPSLVSSHLVSNHTTFYNPNHPNDSVHCLFAFPFICSFLSFVFILIHACHNLFSL